MVPNSVMIHLKVKAEQAAHHALLALQLYGMQCDDDYLNTLRDSERYVRDLLLTIKNCLKHYPAGKDM